MYFPASILAGPVIEFADYRDCSSGALFKGVRLYSYLWRVCLSDISRSQLAGQQPPASLTPTLAAFGKALVFMALVVVAGMFPLSALTTHAFLHEWSYLHKWGYVYFCNVRVHPVFFFFVVDLFCRF